MAYTEIPQLLFGPYKPPDLMVGDRCHCLQFGEVVVIGFTQRIKWPIVRKPLKAGHASFLRTAELKRAIEFESVRTFMYWWDCRSDITVTRIKRALGIPLNIRSAGARKEYAYAVASRTPKMRAEMTRKANIHHAIKWNENDVILIGTMPDRELAKKLNISQTGVAYKRLALGIQSFGSRLRSRWGMRHDHCVECGTNSIPHASRGRCIKCFRKSNNKKTVRSCAICRNQFVVLAGQQKTCSPGCCKKWKNNRTTAWSNSNKASRKRVMVWAAMRNVSQKLQERTYEQDREGAVSAAQECGHQP